MRNFFKKLIPAVFVGIFFAGCSAERNNPFSYIYHNITARYNAYFYANQRIKEVKDGIDQAHQPNYDKILKIFPPLDSTFATRFEVQLDDVIKKSSLVIQNHQNSKWVDDSYILIGRARMYAYDFPNAIETFKYVNTNSDDKNARHEALVYLMRTFIEDFEYNNAIAVSDFLKKEKLNKKNLKNLYLTRAYYYQKMEDYNNMVQNLAMAIPLLRKKDRKARYQFIVGQVYQELGFDAQAYDSYRKCLSSNPDYELSFYAKLNMARVTELTQDNDVRRVRKYFRKLIKDAKNEEFLDKIYYEWGEFELELQNLEDAIEYFNQSIANSTTNRRQKGLSYLRLGQIYFDTLRQYELAQSYYDSTIQVLPSDHENYEAIKERANVLEDFITHVKTIELQDSLLNLSNMDSSALVSYLENVVEEQMAEKEKGESEAKKNRKESRNISFFNQDQTGFQASASNWYFDNPSAISLGQQEFVRIWGDRPLEDHWRRSQKQSSSGYENTGSGVAVNDTSQTLTQGSSINSVEDQVKKMIMQVPFTEDDKKNALIKIENAYYELGNIYYFQFQEETNAANSFKKLINRFRESEYRPEALYLLYLIHKESDPKQSEGYKEELFNQYPNSTYTKLIKNPNFREESNIAIEQQQKIYQSAYRLYRSQDYKEALVKVNEGINQFQETTFTANLDLLKTLIIGKQEGIDEYVASLERFVQQYPDSEVSDYAKLLLEKARATTGENVTEEEIFNTNFNQTHFFVLTFDPDEHSDEIIMNLIEDFNNEHFDTKTLNITSHAFTEERSMILVREFDELENTLEYYDLFLAENVVNDDHENPKFDKFVITRDNFDVLHRNKVLESYKEFFEKNY